MQTKIIVIGGVCIAVLGCGVFLYSFLLNPPETNNTSITQAPSVQVVRTKEGYEPKEIRVKKGDVVLWKNESGEYHWPASDLHPTHAIYSEFDPLKPIAPGGEWTFQFNKAGEWKYHDHIRANKVGTVVVSE